MIAASVLLLYLVRSPPETASSIVKWVKLAIEILDAMDESVVARKSAEILRRYLAEFSSTSDAQFTTVHISSDAVDNPNDSTAETNDKEVPTPVPLSYKRL